MTIVISGQEELEFFELPWATVFPPWRNFFRMGLRDNFIQPLHPGKLNPVRLSDWPQVMKQVSSSRTWTRLLD